MSKLLTLLFSQSFYFVFSYAFTWYLARTIAPADLGVYFVAYAWAHGLYIFSKWGWGVSVLKNCSRLMLKDHDAAARFLGFVYSKLLVRGLLCACLLFLAGIVMHHVYGKSTPIMTLMFMLTPYVLFRPLSEASAQFLRILGKVHTFSLLQYVINPLVKISLVLLGILAFQLYVYAVPVGVVGAELLVFLCAVAIIVRLAGKAALPNRTGDDEPRVTALYSRHIGINLLLLFSLNGLDVVLAGFWVQSQDIASYQIARQLANLLAMALIFFEPVVAPAIARLAAAGEKENLQTAYNDSVFFLSVITMGLAAAMLIQAEELLTLFGKHYGQAAILLRIIGAAQLVNVITGQCGIILNMHGHSGKVLFNAALTFAITVGLVFLLTPFWGVIGLACAVSVSIVTVNLLRFYQIYKLEQVRWLPWRRIRTLLLWLGIALSCCFSGMLLLGGAWGVLLSLTIYYLALLLYFVTLARKDIYRFVDLVLADTNKGSPKKREKFPE